MQRQHENRTSSTEQISVRLIVMQQNLPPVRTRKRERERDRKIQNEDQIDVRLEIYCYTTKEITE